MSFMRRSKYKHVFGTAKKRNECYDAIRITKSSWDSTFCTVNPKFIAIITESAGGGAFLVLSLEKVGRVDINAPCVSGHKAPVLDIQWNPFNDNVIASGSEDCTVKVWEIPDGGLTENLTEPAIDLVAHQRRVGLVLWHPSAENVLLSSGADNMVLIWNIETQTPMIQLDFPDMVLSASFNFDGSKLAVSAKDRITRVIDPRKGETLVEGQCHEGGKPQQVCYLKDGRLFTTGFSKLSERQYAVWNENNLSEALTLEELDTTNGTQFIYYDPDCSIVYLCGKGDSSIRYFEITDEAPYAHFLSQYLSSDPQRGTGWMAKRGVDVNSNEIARLFKLHTKGLCEVVSFTCPRKSELFQEDIYPDTVGDEPALSADEWFAGKNGTPKLISMKENFTGPMAAGSVKAAAPRKILKKAGGGSSAPAAAAPAASSNVGAASKTSAAAPSNGVDPNTASELQALRKDVKELTDMVKLLTQRVAHLESKASAGDHSTGHAEGDADA